MSSKEPETDDELIARWHRVTSRYHRVVARRDKLTYGPQRDAKSRWAGCLNFTKLSIESQLNERGLAIPNDPRDES